MLWWISIQNYISLIEDRLNIICEMEKIFPASPFSAEHENGKFKRRSFTFPERLIPIGFFILYAAGLWAALKGHLS